MTFVSVPTYLEKTTHSTPADPQIRSANAPDARHGDALADAGIVVRPLAAADFQAVMDAYYQQWGMEDDGDPVVSGWWTAALFEKASFGCLAWKGDELFGAAVGHARSMKKLELWSSWKSSVVWAQEAVDKLGAEAMALLDEISICNRRLAQRAQADGRRFAAELDFLWVSPKARGMGLSKRLLTEVHAVMRAHGAQEYALFTDNYCDYSFYQRKPWEKIGEMIWPSPKWAGSSRSFMFARRIA